MQCTYCGDPPLAGRTGKRLPLIVEHVIPRSRGGDNEPGNTTMACLVCNAQKSDRTPMEWHLEGFGITLRPRRGNTRVSDSEAQRFEVRVPDDLHALLVQRARANDRSVNGELLALLRAALIAKPRRRPATK